MWKGQQRWVRMGSSAHTPHSSQQAHMEHPEQTWAKSVGTKKASSQIQEQYLEVLAGTQREDCLVKCPHDALCWQQGRVQLGHCWTILKWVCFPTSWDVEQVMAMWAWPDLS